MALGGAAEAPHETRNRVIPAQEKAQRATANEQVKAQKRRSLEQTNERFSNDEHTMALGGAAEAPHENRNRVIAAQKKAQRASANEQVKAQRREHDAAQKRKRRQNTEQAGGPVEAAESEDLTEMREPEEEKTACSRSNSYGHHTT